METTKDLEIQHLMEEIALLTNDRTNLCNNIIDLERENLELHETIKKMKKENHSLDNEDATQPKHYKMTIKGVELQAFDIMQAVTSPEQYMGFLKCNVIKYILRAPFKNGLEDYKKARVYLEELIKHY